MSAIETEEYIFRGTGAELQQLFDPRVVHAGEYEDVRLSAVSDDVFRALVTDARKYLFSECNKRACADNVVNKSGVYELTGKAAEAMRNAGGAVATLLAHPDIIRLPDTKQERRALAGMLVDSALHYDGSHTIITPVCADYGRGEQFYRTMGGGISPEAQAAINAVRVLKGKYTNYLNPHITILVADTEDDVPEIMGNIAGGSTTIYRRQCEASAQAIRDELGGVDGVSVQTFTQFLGNDFRQAQLAYEAVIRRVMSDDNKFADKLAAIADLRVARHSQILARPEAGFELTIRYMAQYMALGRIARAMTGPVALMNYQTPNRLYYNASVKVHQGLALPDDMKQKVVPVIGTITQR